MDTYTTSSLFEDAQSVSATPDQSTLKSLRKGQENRKPEKSVSLDGKNLPSLSRIVGPSRGISQNGTTHRECKDSSQLFLATQHKALLQNGRFPSVLTDEDAEIRKEALDRIEYQLMFSMSLQAYVIRCSDTHDWLEFGPFTLVEGHMFIDERLARAESLKR